MSHLKSDLVENMMSSDMLKLKKNSKDDLCNFIMVLRTKVEELESYQLISKRVLMLEKTIVRSLQYQRRENVEIHGMPETINDKELEGKCLNIFQDIGCGEIKPSQVHACHRLKNKKNVIIRFVNRKNANNVLHNKAKLKDLKLEKYGLGKNVRLFINESLCLPLQFLAYKVRQAYKHKVIQSYNIWKGRISLKLVKDGENIFITHIQDLIDINLATEEDRNEFMV